MIDPHPQPPPLKDSDHEGRLWSWFLECQDAFMAHSGRDDRLAASVRLLIAHACAHFGVESPTPDDPCMRGNAQWLGTFFSLYARCLVRCQQLEEAARAFQASVAIRPTDLVIVAHGIEFLLSQNDVVSSATLINQMGSSNIRAEDIVADDILTWCLCHPDLAAQIKPRILKTCIEAIANSKNLPRFARTLTNATESRTKP